MTHRILTFRRELTSDESKAAYDFFENAKVLRSFCRFEQGDHDAYDGAHRVHGIGDRGSGLARWSASFRAGIPELGLAVTNVAPVFAAEKSTEDR